MAGCFTLLNYFGLDFSGGSVVSERGLRRLVSGGSATAGTNLSFFYGSKFTAESFFDSVFIPICCSKSVKTLHSSFEGFALKRLWKTFSNSVKSR